MSPLAERLAPISARLSRIRNSIRLLFGIDGASRVLLAVGGFVAVTFLMDWALILPAYVRVVMLAAGLVLLGALVFRRLLRPLGVRVTDDDLALFVERHYPELNDRLISAIQLAREPLSAAPEGAGVASYNSPELVEALLSDAEQATSALDFRRVIVGKHVGKIAAWAGVVAAFIIAGSAFFPVYASTYLNRLFGGGAKWPQRTHLQVLDFENFQRVIPRGDDLAIAVAYQGRRPGKVVLEYRFESGEKGRERMSELTGDRFQFVFTRVTGPFEFTVTGNDDTTEPHFVKTLPPPSLESVKLFYEYPAYLRKPNTPPDQPETAGNVVAPFHTKVRFEAETSEDLKAAQLGLGLRGKEVIQPLEIARAADGRPRRFTGVFEVREPYSEYALQITAQNGLSNRDPLRFTIKGIEDRPPDIVVREPLGDEFVTDRCARPLELEVRDDYGVARIALEYRVHKAQKPGEWVVVEFTREQNTREYGETFMKSEHVLDIGKLGVQAGDHVELRFRAEDYKDVGTSPKFRLSKVYKLSIVAMGTLEKELQDAIEKIKQQLKAQKARQESAWNATGRLITKFGRADQLNLEEQGEVRQKGLEQNDITSKLDTARKEIRHVMRRGVYNKIFDQAAAEHLQGAIDELEILVGDGSGIRPGYSRVAAARLDQAARLKTGQERTGEFREAQSLQSAVATGIQKALDFLEKWSSYQEVVRTVREIKERHDRNLEEIKKGGK